MKMNNILTPSKLMKLKKKRKILYNYIILYLCTLLYKNK